MTIQVHEHSNQTFDQCIKCTVCTAYCPVSKANPGYPGPKQSGPDGERLRIKSQQLYDDALYYCTNCKRCEIACPSGVRIGDIIQKARWNYGTKKPGLREFILSHTDLLGELSTTVAPVVNFTTGFKPMKVVLDKVLGVTQHRDLPKYSWGNFRRRFKKEATDQDQYPRQIAFYHGCYVNYNHPQLGFDMIKVLNAMGIGVQILDSEKCCGVPMMSNGLYNKAKKNAEFNAKHLTKASQKVEKIVSCSSTCTFTIRDEYEHVLGVDTSNYRDQMELITRFIYREFEKGNVPKMKSLDMKAVYHTPCHLEKSGGVLFTLNILDYVPGLDVERLDSQCCGIAGTYGFKKENYEVSQRIGQGIFDQINASDAKLCICDCETCKWQIEMSTGMETQHPISIIAQALADE